MYFVEYQLLNRRATIHICFATVAQDFRGMIQRVSVFPARHGNHDTKLWAPRLAIIWWSLLTPSACLCG